MAPEASTRASLSLRSRPSRRIAPPPALPPAATIAPPASRRPSPASTVILPPALPPALIRLVGVSVTALLPLR
jgi:hypothetical protein